ncbi:MAG: F0F1 ATP synthase subunit gamma [Vampirovibrionales bacterium]
MPNLKDIRRRIKSVKNTQKITQAMRMVAAAKVKRAELKVKAIRPYSQSLQQVLAQVATTLPDGAEAPILAWLKSLPHHQSPQKPIILVVSSDRGLCGSFNSAVIRQALKLEQHLKEQGIAPTFVTVGRKVTQALKRYVVISHCFKPNRYDRRPTLAHARGLVQTLSKAF